MADQRLITLRPGDASPKDIILRELPVADVAATTTIYLRAGDATPKDVILRDPTLAPSGGSATHDTTGALVASLAAISGTASHHAVHASSGALTGPGSSIAGTAHVVIHASIGVLIAQGAILSGNASRSATHTSVGSLVGQASGISGTANRVAIHASSGDLVGQPSEVSGAASKITSHDSVGALVGGGSAITGTATGPGIQEPQNQTIGGGYYRWDYRKRTKEEIHAERVRMGIAEAEQEKAAISVRIQEAPKPETAEQQSDAWARHLYHELLSERIAALEADWAIERARQAAQFDHVRAALAIQYAARLVELRQQTIEADMAFIITMMAEA